MTLPLDELRAISQKLKPLHVQDTVWVDALTLRPNRSYAASRGAPTAPVLKARGAKGRRRAVAGRWTAGPRLQPRQVLAQGEVGKIECFRFITSPATLRYPAQRTVELP